MTQEPCIQFVLTGNRQSSGAACYVAASIVNAWGYAIDADVPSGDTAVFFAEDQFKYSVVGNQGLARNDDGQWNVITCEMPLL